MQQELQLLEEHSNLRRLPRMVHDGRDVIVDGKRDNGEVKGWQTADNVIQMVRDYKCNKSR